MEKSKKLKLDADGNIVLDDGAEALEDMQKEAEEISKETEKDLEAKEKVVDDINNAKESDPKFTNGEGKKLTIKKLKEKLTLSEDCDMDEAIPHDLAKSYKTNSFRPKSNIDLQNANYEEVTPQEAMRLIKAGKAGSLRLLINHNYGNNDASSRLITLKPTGYGDTDYRDKYVPSGKEYVKRNGDEVYDTAHMPVAHLLGIADKIYYTNESDTFKNQDLLNKRQQNPESPNYSGSMWGTEGRYRQPERNYKKDDYSGQGYYLKKIKEYEDRLKNLKTQYENGNIPEDSYKSSKERYVYNINNYKHELDNYRTPFARLRNAESEKKLREPFEKFDELKRKIKNSQSYVINAKEKLDRAKDNGSPETARMKEEYNSLLSKLRQIQRDIALYELRLEDTNLADEEAVKSAQSAYDNYVSQLNDAQSELNKLLKRS